MGPDHFVMIAVASLANSSLPTGLVATKCDTPENLRQLDTMALANTFTSCVIHYKTTSNVPGSARECLHAMLRTTLALRRGKNCTFLVLA